MGYVPQPGSPTGRGAVSPGSCSIARIGDVTNFTHPRRWLLTVLAPGGALICASSPAWQAAVASQAPRRRYSSCPMRTSCIGLALPWGSKWHRLGWVHVAQAASVARMMILLLAAKWGQMSCFACQIGPSVSNSPESGGTVTRAHGAFGHGDWSTSPRWQVAGKQSVLCIDAIAGSHSEHPGVGFCPCFVSERSPA
jgi:hypothetical protein